MFPLSVVVCHATIPRGIDLRLWHSTPEVLEVALAVAPSRSLNESPLHDGSAFRSARLEESVSRSLAGWLAELEADDLVEQPSSPTGLTMTLQTTGDDGVSRRVVIGAPRGRAASVLGLVVSAAAWQTKLLGRGERPVFDAVKAELAEFDATRLTKRHLSTHPILFRAASLGIDSLEVGVDAAGPHATDGVCREALPPELHLRAVSMVAALVATRTKRMGAGECLFEISFEGTRVEVRCPVAGQEPLLAKLPLAAGPTVRSLFVLAGALAEEDDAQRGRDLAAWAQTLPSVTRAVRTDDLVLRFHMNDVRYGRPGACFYRLDVHGTITRSEGGTEDDEGRAVMPHAVEPAAIERIRKALSACDALGVGTNASVTPHDECPDDDSYIELTVQRPSDRGEGRLETMRAGWAYGRMAQYDRGPEMERGLAAVYELYQALMQIRGPADIR